MSDKRADPEDGKPDGLILYDFDPRNIPNEYLRAIGLVAMASAQTESTMQDFIGAILHIDNIETLALTTHMTVPMKEQVARTVIELNAASAAVVDEVDDILDRIRDALAKRNVMIHSPLCRHPHTEEVSSQRLSARGTIDFELRPISVKEIEDVAEEIYDAGMDLMRFMMAAQIGPLERPHQLRQPLPRSKKARESRRQQKSRN
jgi:hypothetical protein